MPGGRFDQTGKGTIYRERIGDAVERDVAGRRRPASGPGGDPVSLIANCGCGFEMVMTTLPGGQDIPCDRLAVIGPAMRPDHFPRIDDSSIWSGEKAERYRREHGE
jgi:hypothetical protein